MPTSPDPLDALRVLARAGIPFVIIGGHAVNFHGYVRTTEDSDIIFHRTPTLESALYSALKSLRACWISDEIDPATGTERLVPISPAYVRTQNLMMLNTTAGFLDIYDYVPGFPEIPVQRLLDDSILLGELRFVSLAWLRQLKQHAARHKDLDDLEHLPAV